MCSFNKEREVTGLSDAGPALSPPRSKWQLLWNLSCHQNSAGAVLAVMGEIISRVFVVGVLLFYAGLVIAFVLWNLGRRLRKSEKGKERPDVLGRSVARRIFNRRFGAP